MTERPALDASGICAECGFDNTTLDNAALVELIRSSATGWATVDLSEKRPAPAVWSPREYAAHLIEGMEWYAERIELVLREDRPQLVGRDFTVDPVVPEGDLPARIDEVVRKVAERLDALTPEQWNRVGMGSSDGAERDIRTLASRLAHEAHHHLLDVGRSW